MIVRQVPVRNALARFMPGSRNARDRGRLRWIVNPQPPRNEPSSPLGSLSEPSIRTSIRPTVARIDVDALRRNAQRLRALMKSTVALWAVIKADAYGHGAIRVARALEPVCDGFAVSLAEEGLELRAAGIRSCVLVLGAYYDGQHEEVVARGLTPVVYDVADLYAFSAAGARRGLVATIHLKVETGMNRLGVPLSELHDVLERIEKLPALRLGGLCTHFASADVADDGTTDQAILSFQKCLADARKLGFRELQNHAANSAATIRFPNAHFDAVRPGLALYGAAPSSAVNLDGFEPVLRLSTRIMAIHNVAPGEPVSYGGLWRALRPSRIGTLPIGYADGYPRHVRHAVALVGSRRVPIVGAVCMDMLMLDLTDAPSSNVGDVAVLIGDYASEQITIDDLARWAGTVNYEVLCGISKRVPRI